MSVDWTKYPPLPKPPKLPEWRDLPEHEAYWKEVDSITTPLENDIIILGWFGLWILFSILFCWFFWFGENGTMVSIFAGTIVGYIFAEIPWKTCRKIFFHIAKHKISKRYGFSLKKLNRPDISKEIGKVLAFRLDFNEAEFRKYWPAKTGLEYDAMFLLETAKKEWLLHKKMLYPNDPLLLLFYGRIHKFGKEKMIEDTSSFFESVALEFEVYDFNGIDNASTLADFLEICRKKKVKEAMSQ
jgi:hypothetical protein